jgi:hypothetical protein
MNPRHSHEAAQHEERTGHTGHLGGGHRWMMVACCVPMLAIAIVLVATGVVGVGFIFIALLCTAMMALMHGGMSHTDNNDGNRQ